MELLLRSHDSELHSIMLLLQFVSLKDEIMHVLHFIVVVVFLSAVLSTPHFMFLSRKS